MPVFANDNHVFVTEYIYRLNNSVFLLNKNIDICVVVVVVVINVGVAAAIVVVVFVVIDCVLFMNRSKQSDSKSSIRCVQRKSTKTIRMYTLFGNVLPNMYVYLGYTSWSTGQAFSLCSLVPPGRTPTPENCKR